MYPVCAIYAWSNDPVCAIYVRSRVSRMHGLCAAQYISYARFICGPFKCLFYSS